MASAMKRNSDLLAPRGPARKRGPGARADKDGDISMGMGPRNNNRVGKSGGRGGQRGGANRPSLGRNGVNPSTLERAVLKSGESAFANARQRNNNSAPRTESMQIRVSGWKNNKASANDDKGIGALITFIENKARTNRSKALKAGRLTGNPDVNVKVKKYTIESDDSLTFHISSDVGYYILRMDGWVFAGTNLSIKRIDHRSPSPQQSTDATTKLRQALTRFLDRRYNPDEKLLDLSSLGLDPDLNELGVFQADKTSAKVFPAIMKHCESLFKAAERREKFIAVTLHSNELTSVETVKNLAYTFPDLKNLDLSNNKLTKLEDLGPWKNRFRHLDHLVLTNNPIEQAVPEYHIEMLKWYPTLRFLNSVQIRSDADVALAQSAESQKKGLPVKTRVMLGDADITNNFVGVFFPGFDADRNALVNMYYDKDSQFSFAVNNHAMRDPSTTEALTKAEWESYIRRSRNLKAISHLPARQSRLFVGQEQIREAFMTIPATKHAAEAEKVHIECQSLPVVPDGTGQYPQGVVGLLITVHGEYDEIDVSTGQATKRRSYDRAITLGPGLTASGLRVINDMLTVRAYGGNAALQPDQIVTEQDNLAIEFSKHTGMTFEYSKMCLEQSNWDPPTAVATFETAKATLPPEAFITAPVL
ncbi:putative mrna export factor mex67 protein [Neofusicoccum parvum UCRNP2]|uniref:mRNA export factor MEX67 n=1 Tax=Botryosphaeria parva (strain UCR-NP2) TaxID=1287680 RepID=R1ER05_BOTPV|nr:putative mrna export factor mex67 protein [Neofusicoccum parvum UCRNP2]